MDSFSIRNFGCRVNQAEAFGWAHELQKRGLRHEEHVGRGGLVIVNTCTLTGRADRDARKFIRKVLRENPSAKVVVTGCLAERDPRAFETLPGIWMVLPNQDKDTLPERLLPGAAVRVTDEIRTVRARAYLKVQDGCDQACAFCVIPGVRGRSSSVPGDEVLSRVRDLAGLGFREIVLAGIHLGSYGNDLRPRSSLAGLLEEIDHISGDFRVRLSSLDPRLLPRPLLEHLTISPKICPHFHLSLQTGSDGVLRAMGRNSTVFQYREIMEYFSRAAPQAALGADVIVGFPGESDDDFRATEDFLAASPLAYVHVFSYSPRPGTAASSRPPVDERTKRARAVRLRGLSREKNLEFRKRFSGAILDGVAIRVGGEGVEVLTPNYIAVRAPFGAVRKGDRVRVKITKVQERETLGEIIPNKKCHPERSEGSRPTPRVPSQGSGRLKESPERSEGSPPT